jgi:hypothetical protein
MRLSKSKFTQGLGCHRALWWAVHEPDAPEREVGPALQAIFDQGTRVGELARAHVPGGHLIDFPYTESEKRIEATRAALAGGARTIYEAAFREDDVFVAVDILHRASARRSWTLTEVKSTTKVKNEHVPDAAVQLHVLQRAGLPITRVEVMHLNRECRFPDLTDLFTRSDVTDEVTDYLPNVAPEVKAQLVMLRRSKPPAIEPGAQCSAPYECVFMSRCWPAAPEHGIATLCHLSAAKREALIDEGYETIFDLPDDVELMVPVCCSDSAAIYGPRVRRACVPGSPSGQHRHVGSRGVDAPLAEVTAEHLQHATPTHLVMASRVPPPLREGKKMTGNH